MRAEAGVMRLAGSRGLPSVDGGWARRKQQSQGHVFSRTVKGNRQQERFRIQVRT